MTETHWGPAENPGPMHDQAHTSFLSNIRKPKRVHRTTKKEKPAIQDLLDDWADELGLQPEGDVSAAILTPETQDQIAIYLSALLAMTRGVYEVAHSLHWRTSGQESYQDHLLFERVYNEVYSFIDGLGEKTVGISDRPGAVEANLQAQATARFIALLPQSQSAGDFPADMLHAVTELLQFIEGLLLSLEQVGGLTAGLDNFLQGMADKIETLVYLLHRRVATNAAV